MAVSAALTGGSLADGDLLRRAIKKTEGEERERLRREFVRRAGASGVSARDAEAVWVHLEKFAMYGFCRAHASGYGVLAWRSAILKARFPVEYYCAVMNNHAGMYPSRVHLEEAKRMAPPGFTFCTTNMGEYVFRRKLIPNGPIVGPIRVTPGKTIKDALEGKSPA